MATQNITGQISRLLDYMEGELVIDSYVLVISDDPKRWSLAFPGQAPVTKYDDLEVLAFVRGVFAARKIIDLANIVRHGIPA